MSTKKEKLTEKQKAAQKEKHVTNICLTVIAIVLIIFTSAVLFIFLKTGSEPDTLIVSFFSACTGELGFMALIKNSKHKYNVDDDDEDREEKEEPEG